MVIGRVARLFPKAFQEGVAVVGDDVARAAFNRSKAEEMARTGINNYDDYTRLYKQHYDDLGGNTPSSNPYSEGQGMLYSLGRTVGSVGAGAGGVANAMGGPAGIAMNAAFLAPMFLSAGGGGREAPAEVSPSPDPQLEMLQQAQQNPEYARELMLRAQVEDMKKRRAAQERQMIQAYTSPSTSTYSMRGAFET